MSADAEDREEAMRAAGVASFTELKAVLRAEEACAFVWSRLLATPFRRVASSAMKILKPNEKSDFVIVQAEKMSTQLM